MKIIGITGGMGSGKSKVMEFFAAKGHPCYAADKAGHRLLRENEQLITTIRDAFGDSVFTPSGEVDRKKLGTVVFNDSKKLAALNAIIHPAVAADYATFLAQHKQEPLLFKEAAILIESGSYKQCDIILLVRAPASVRFRRIEERDGLSVSEITPRMQQQWSDAKKAEYADYVIDNLDWEATILQLESIYADLIA